MKKEQKKIVMSYVEKEKVPVFEIAGNPSISRGFRVFTKVPIGTFVTLCGTVLSAMEIFFDEFLHFSVLAFHVSLDSEAVRQGLCNKYK